MVSDEDLGFAALRGAGSPPRDAWEEVSARFSGAGLRAALEAMRASDRGRAALEQSRQQWLAQGFTAPWEPAIAPVALAEVVPDGFTVPEGTTAARCAACGETRLSYPGDLTDEWKHHFDYCTYPEVSPAEPGPEVTR
jgi:hypothetical protein